VPPFKLNALLEQGENAFLSNLAITSDGIIIDGYARWEVARLQHRRTVQCIEYNLSESEALHQLLLSHRPSAGFVPFNRIVLAMGLENHFKQQARQHQQEGGRNKGSSKLTEAERVEVCKKIADAAGVSVGTLNHVKQLLPNVDPAIRQALQDGEIRIHRAWRWSKLSRDAQREELKSFRRGRGMDKIVARLVADQVRRQHPNLSVKPTSQRLSSGETVNRLAALGPDLLSSVNVVVVSAPGRRLALSDEIARDLGY
jgi:hypothetical protein